MLVTLQEEGLNMVLKDHLLNHLLEPHLKVGIITEIFVLQSSEAQYKN